MASTRCALCSAWQKRPGKLVIRQSMNSTCRSTCTSPTRILTKSSSSSRMARLSCTLLGARFASGAQFVAGRSRICARRGRIVERGIARVLGPLPVKRAAGHLHATDVERDDPEYDGDADRMPPICRTPRDFRTCTRSGGPPPFEPAPGEISGGLAGGAALPRTGARRPNCRSVMTSPVDYVSPFAEALDPRAGPGAAQLTIARDRAAGRAHARWIGDIENVTCAAVTAKCSVHCRTDEHTASRPRRSAWNGSIARAGSRAPNAATRNPPANSGRPLTMSNGAAPRPDAAPGAAGASDGPAQRLIGDQHHRIRRGRRGRASCGDSRRDRPLARSSRRGSGFASSNVEHDHVELQRRARRHLRPRRHSAQALHLLGAASPVGSDDAGGRRAGKTGDGSSSRTRSRRA